MRNKQGYECFQRAITLRIMTEKEFLGAHGLGRVKRKALSERELSSAVEQRLYTATVIGSIPIAPTIFLTSDLKRGV
jgi:hypothetical protein